MKDGVSIILAIQILLLLRLAKCELRSKRWSRSDDDCQVRMYIGSYNLPEDVGITAYNMNDDGNLKKSSEFVDKNTSFMTINNKKKIIYAVNELDEFPRQTGTISAYLIEDWATGELRLINRLSSRGNSPAYVTLDPSSRFLLTGNYGSGNVVVYKLNEAGGLSHVTSEIYPPDNFDRIQAKVHMVAFHPTERDLVVVDFLGMDRIYFYRFNESCGALTPLLVDGSWYGGGIRDHVHVQVEPRTGPRHFTFSKDGIFLYVVGEHLPTVTVFKSVQVPDSGLLVGYKRLQIIATLPSNFVGVNDGAEIALHPNGEFLYTSNRGHDSIAIYAVDQRDGTLTSKGFQPTGGKTPRHFAITPCGQELIVGNQNSNSVISFEINLRNGQLTRPVIISDNILSPVFVLYQALSNN